MYTLDADESAFVIDLTAALKGAFLQPAIGIAEGYEVSRTVIWIIS